MKQPGRGPSAYTSGETFDDPAGVDHLVPVDEVGSVHARPADGTRTRAIVMAEVSSGTGPGVGHL